MDMYPSDEHLSPPVNKCLSVEHLPFLPIFVVPMERYPTRWPLVFPKNIWLSDEHCLFEEHLFFRRPFAFPVNNCFSGEYVPFL